MAWLARDWNSALLAFLSKEESTATTVVVSLVSSVILQVIYSGSHRQCCCNPLYFEKKSSLRINLEDLDEYDFVGNMNLRDVVARFSCLGGVRRSPTGLLPSRLRVEKRIVGMCIPCLLCIFTYSIHLLLALSGNLYNMELKGNHWKCLT